MQYLKDIKFYALSVTPLLVLSVLSSCSVGVNVSFFSEPGANQDLVLVLSQPITIPMQHVSIKIQNGQLSQGVQLDKYHANCNFELRQIVEMDTVISPDVFSIISVNLEKSYVQAGHFYFASLSGMAANESPQAADMSTEFYLKSEKQPQVYRLTCSHWDDPNFPRFLSLEQINSTLSGWFEVRQGKSKTQ